MRRTGWDAEAFAVIVIDPELENWIWQRKPYVVATNHTVRCFH